VSAIVDVVAQVYASDPDAADAFLDDVVDSYVAELAEHAWFVHDVAKAARTVIDTSRAALAREYVAKAFDGQYPSEDYSLYAHWLGGLSAYIAQAGTDQVSKAFGWEDWFRGGRQRRVQVARDEQGRFARIVDTNRTSSISGTAPARVSDAVRARPELYETDKLTEQGREQADTLDRHQAQWEQANDAVKDLHRMLRGETKGVRVVLTRDKAGNAAAPLTFDLAEARAGIPAAVALALNPVDEEIKSVSIEYDEGASDVARARIARFNSFGILADGAAGFASTMDRPEGGRSAFDRTFAAQLGENVQRPGSDVFYERARGAASVLQAVGADKPAKFAHLVGTLGPEADAVLGPHVRRAAYRYRGTEKSPDRELLQEFSSANMRMVQAIAEGQVPNEAVREMREGMSARGAGVVGSSFASRARRASGDQLALQVRADVAAAHLVTALPTDPKTAKLSEKAGDVLPSQGVLINADGEVIAQAVGYADDHYLPFNLGNLTQLRGGQYVRTRVAGGPTGEDVYAAIKGGARMVTVVSSSGVYSLEFDPNFRGGRAMTDRAQSMYQRYLKILDAVDQSGMYLKDVGPEVHDRAERAGRQAAAYLPAGSTDAKAAHDRVRDQVLAEAREAERYGYDPEALKTQAQELAQADPQWGRLNSARQAQLVADVFDELKTEAQAAGVQELTLNAEGYRLALETLKQQFPYFIRNVSHEPLTQGRTGADGAGFLDRVGAPGPLRAAGTRLQSRGRTDSGYVSPGGLRPDSTRSGYYATGNASAPPKQRGEAPAAAPSAAAAPAAATATSSTGGTGGTPGAPPPSAGQRKSDASPLGRRLAELQRYAKPQADAAVTAFLTPLEGLGQPVRTDAMGRSWDELGDSTVERAKWLLSNTDQLRTMLSDPRAQEALGDTKAVEAAFKAIHPEIDADALVDDSRAADFGGATNAGQAATFIAAQAAQAVAWAGMDQPFAEGTNDPFYTGAKPQAFEDLMALDSRQALEGFANRGEGQQLAELADAMGQYGPPEQVVPTMVKALRQIGPARDAVMADVQSGRMNTTAITGLQTKVATEIATRMQMSPAELEAVLGGPVDGARLNDAAIQARGLQLQRAWALQRVRQVVDAIEPGPGGTPPFVQLPQDGSARTVGKSLSHRPELAGLQVLGLEHPATVAAILASAGIG
jgi:hypothetical protein